MIHAFATVLLGLSVVGILVFAVQVGCAIRHLRQPPPTPTSFPWISVLKPLCGVDDRLEQNLESFGAIEYLNCEVLLGVEHRDDPAYAIACQMAARWPERMRVVLQHGEPGLNPKVNQLITLARNARHDLLVVSDSNVAVHPGYLDEIAGYFEDSRVGIVTHPIVGLGERTLGSLLDNLHLCVSITPGLVAVNRLTRTPIVVGKSMALKRDDLRTIGGFEAFKDVLAEDYVIGKAIVNVCGKQVAVAHRPVMNMSCSRTLPSFLDRYARWNVLQRNSVSQGMYVAALLLNPWPFALAALIAAPSRSMLVAVFSCALAKAALELLAARAARATAFPWFSVLVVPCKDLLLLVSWIRGLMTSEVGWRGRRFAMLAGTRLVPVTSPRASDLVRKTLLALGRSVHLTASRSKPT